MTVVVVVQATIRAVIFNYSLAMVGDLGDQIIHQSQSRKVGVH